jgi:hypothetical protein
MGRSPQPNFSLLLLTNEQNKWEWQSALVVRETSAAANSHWVYSESHTESDLFLYAERILCVLALRTLIAAVGSRLYCCARDWRCFKIAQTRVLRSSRSKAYAADCTCENKVCKWSNSNGPRVGYLRPGRSDVWKTPALTRGNIQMMTDHLLSLGEWKM